MPRHVGHPVDGGDRARTVGKPDPGPREAEREARIAPVGSPGQLVELLGGSQSAQVLVAQAEGELRDDLPRQRPVDCVKIGAGGGWIVSGQLDQAVVPADAPVAVREGGSLPEPSEIVFDPDGLDRR